jgi:hypothetical protein
MARSSLFFFQRSRGRADRALFLVFNGDVEMSGSRLFGVVGIVLIATAPAMAGVVTFDPLSADVLAGTQVAVQIDISTSLPQQNLAIVTIGLNDAAGDLANFVYDPDWTTPFTPDPPVYDASASYPHSITVGGQGLGSSSSYTLGSFIIDTAGMVPGNYTVSVDFNIDAESEFVLFGEDDLTDPLFGTFDLTILPEPGCLVLLALAGLTVVTRRR